MFKIPTDLFNESLLQEMSLIQSCYVGVYKRPGVQPNETRRKTSTNDRRSCICCHSLVLASHSRKKTVVRRDLDKTCGAEPEWVSWRWVSGRPVHNVGRNIANALAKSLSAAIYGKPPCAASDFRRTKLDGLRSIRYSSDGRLQWRRAIARASAINDSIDARGAIPTEGSHGNTGTTHLQPGRWKRWTEA